MAPDRHAATRKSIHANKTSTTTSFTGQNMALSHLHHLHHLQLLHHHHLQHTMNLLEPVSGSSTLERLPHPPFPRPSPFFSTSGRLSPSSPSPFTPPNLMFAQFTLYTIHPIPSPPHPYPTPSTIITAVGLQVIEYKTLWVGYLLLSQNEVMSLSSWGVMNLQLATA